MKSQNVQSSIKPFIDDKEGSDLSFFSFNGTYKSVR